MYTLSVELKLYNSFYFVIISYKAMSHAGYLRTDISGIDQASIFHVYFILFDVKVYMNK